MMAYLRRIYETYQVPGYNQPGLEVYYVTLQYGIEFKSCSSFWGSFCRTLRANYHQRFGYDDSEPASAATFPSFFRNPQKPVILVIDEASMLYEMNKQDTGNRIIGDFIGALRGLKDNYLDFSLHSVVLVGTESIRELLAGHGVEGRSIFSPF